MQIPKTANTGARNCASRIPDRSSTTAFPAIALITTRKVAGKTRVKKAATGVRQKLRVE